MERKHPSFHKHLYLEIWVDFLGTLREDANFSDMSRDLDNNRATLVKKGHYMDRSEFTNKTLTPTAALHTLETLVSK